jgi:hypothetical protein
MGQDAPAGGVHKQPGVNACDPGGLDSRTLVLSRRILPLTLSPTVISLSTINRRRQISPVFDGGFGASSFAGADVLHGRQIRYLVRRGLQSRWL